MGPLTLADFIGLDTCLFIAEVLHRELGEDKYRPAALLRQYVAAGWYGRKTGRGFYKLRLTGDDHGATRTCSVDVEDGVGVLTFNRPKVLNALDATTIAELGEVRRARRGRPRRCRALVLTGAGEKAFVAGADIAAMSTMPPAEARRFAETAHADPRAAGGAPHRHHRRRERVRARRRLRDRDGLRPRLREREGALRPARGEPRAHPGVRRDAAAHAARRDRPGPGDGPHRRHGTTPRRRRRSGSRSRCSRPRSSSPSRRRRRGRSPRRRRSRSPWRSAASARAPTPICASGASSSGRPSRALFGTEDAREGMKAFLEKRPAKFQGR